MAESLLYFTFHVYILYHLLQTANLRKLISSLMLNPCSLFLAGLHRIRSMLRAMYCLSDVS